MLRGPATAGIGCNLDIAHVDLSRSEWIRIKKDFPEQDSRCDETVEMIFLFSYFSIHFLTFEAFSTRAGSGRLLEQAAGGYKMPVEPLRRNAIR